VRFGFPIATLAVGALMLAGCTAAARSEETAAVASPFAACTAAPGASSGAAGSSHGASPAAAGSSHAASPAAVGSSPGGSPAAAVSSPGADLPDITVECFAGGDGVDLRALRGPAVINIWATYCGPCRDELPVVQRLADTGKLTVLGLDTGDSRPAAASFGSDHGVTMPTLYDPDRKAISRLGVVNLPSTIFVDASGKTYIHRYPMDAAGLAELVREHTGISVQL
jgi:cytochrome c biogenesis protein CcmG/thiol:disulfide interchange protein DsbE